MQVPLNCLDFFFPIYFLILYDWVLVNNKECYSPYNYKMLHMIIEVTVILSDQLSINYAKYTNKKCNICLTYKLLLLSPMNHQCQIWKKIKQDSLLSIQLYMSYVHIHMLAVVPWPYYSFSIKWYLQKNYNGPFSNSSVVLPKMPSWKTILHDNNYLYRILLIYINNVFTIRKYSEYWMFL